MGICVRVCTCIKSIEEPTTLYPSLLKEFGFMKKWFIPVLRQEMYKMGLQHLFVPQKKYAQKLVWPVKVTYKTTRENYQLPKLRQFKHQNI